MFYFQEKLSHEKDVTVATGRIRHIVEDREGLLMWPDMDIPPTHNKMFSRWSKKGEEKYALPKCATLVGDEVLKMLDAKHMKMNDSKSFRPLNKRYKIWLFCVLFADCPAGRKLRQGLKEPTEDDSGKSISDYAERVTQFCKNIAGIYSKTSEFIHNPTCRVDNARLLELLEESGVLDLQSRKDAFKLLLQLET